MAERPLSPHLSIWKWGPAMFVSIMHRVSGSVLAFAGLPLLLWWLWALASGQLAYTGFSGWVWADPATLTWAGFSAISASIVKLVLKLAVIASSWALFNHMCSGIRHFVLDLGAGFELETNNRWALLSVVGGIVLTGGFWALVHFL